jgi:hypothetical protein
MKLRCSSTISLILLLGCALTAVAKTNADRTQFSHDIRVEVGDKAGELTCINCSVYVYGSAAGDVTAIHGSVVVESGGSVGGDITTVLGDVRVEPSAAVGGDVTAVGGTLRRQNGASVGGDVTTIESKLAILFIMASPFVLLGLIVALVVWLIQRNRQTRVVPA